jgi:ribose transport system substrate-binding protein
MENGYIDDSVTWDAQSHATEAVRVIFDILQSKDPQCGPNGCLAKGSLATPATIKGMTDYWARKYK